MIGATLSPSVLQRPKNAPETLSPAESAEPVARAPVLTIDLDALAANYRDLARAVAPAECAAVVKADAYGLGAAETAPTLAAAGCRTFFVATLEEGIALRARLARERIFVFEGPEPANARDFLAHGLSPVLNRLDQTDFWRAFALRSSAEPAACALQIDTGMARLGLTPREIEILAADPARLERFPLAFTMSHLACAEDPGNPLNAEQRARFERLRALLPPVPASLANSAGCDLGASFHYDLVRPGIALYGSRCGGPLTASMRPVVGIEARILQVREIDRPETVGYGATHAVNGPTRIATLNLGYADGYKRSLSNTGSVALDGQFLPVVGRVSMDLVTIDVTNAPPGAARPGAVVEALGPNVALDAVAEAAGTIPHDILTGLGRRFERRYVGGPGRATE